MTGEILRPFSDYYGMSSFSKSNFCDTFLYHHWMAELAAASYNSINVEMVVNQGRQVLFSRLDQVECVVDENKTDRIEELN